VNKNLGLIATLVPLIIVAIGLVGWVLSLRSDVTSTVQQVEAVQVEVEDLRVRLVDLEKNLAIADDQMRTIMGEHEVIGEMFKEMGEIQPAGERRTYGGYGN
jgi:hypothetical protein